MARIDPQMKLRLPEELKNRIEEAATKAGRSLNAEVLARLEASFQPIERARTDEVESIIGKTVEVTMATMEKRGWTPPAPKPAVKRASPSKPSK